MADARSPRLETDHPEDHRRPVALAANPDRCDGVVTSNLFGDIGSDVAAKAAGGGHDISAQY